jgi:hypothetical protein
MPLAAAPEPKAAGEVRMILAGGDMALVALDAGGTVTVRQEHLASRVPLDRALAVGMRVEGLLNADGRALRIAFESPSQAMLDAMFPDGVVTLALVTKTSGLGGRLALHPDVLVAISRSDISSNRNDRVDDLLEVGEIVAARVFRHTDGTIRLRTLDVDDDEPITPSLRLLPDGPEWLRLPEEPEGEQAEEVDEVDPAPLVGVEAAVDAMAAHPAGSDLPEGKSALRTALLRNEHLKAENAELRRERDAAAATSPEEMRAVRAEYGQVLRENRELGDQVRTTNRDLAKAKKALRARVAAAETPRDRRHLFGPAEDWIRHELYLAYLERVGYQDRAEFPMSTDFVLGEEFATSLEILDDGCLEKALKTCVDVLTGRATEVNGRQVHALRTSEVGNAPQRVREDGARCFRCAIENGTPSARRLHYWKRDGVVELSRVVLHDDMKP